MPLPSTCFSGVVLVPTVQCALPRDPARLSPCYSVLLLLAHISKYPVAALFLSYCLPLPLWARIILCRCYSVTILPGSTATLYPCYLESLLLFSSVLLFPCFSAAYYRRGARLFCTSTFQSPPPPHDSRDLFTVRPCYSEHILPCALCNLCLCYPRYISCYVLVHCAHVFKFDSQICGPLTQRFSTLLSWINCNKNCAAPAVFACLLVQPLFDKNTHGKQHF